MADSGLTRRDFLRLAGVGAASLAIPGSLMAAVEGAAKKPNVVYIVADDQGYGELSCQGCKDIPTPNIDSIAKNGIRFTNGYVSCPVCSPTRAGLMTGRYQQRFGHEFNPGPAELAEPNFGLPLSQKTMADYMKAQGYATGAVGKWHLGYKPEFYPQKRGFDEFFGFLGGAHSYIDAKADKTNMVYRGTEQVDEKEYLTTAFGREAASFIERHKDKPFYLYLAFNAVHSPLQSPAGSEDWFKEVTDPKRRTFLTMQKAMDDAVGVVMDKLRTSGLEENTLVIFLSDNGGPTPSTTSKNDPLSGFKGQTLEGGIRIPYMMQWKGHVPAGKVDDRPVISLDILPTAVALAGGKPGANVDGVNLLPYVTGKKSGDPHQYLFWRYGDQSAVRGGDWKLVSREGTTQLYNLADDIKESKDLAAEEADKFSELDAAYKAWDAKNIAPLWKTQKNKNPGKKKNKMK
ncbi:MAG TPA: sulfatase-like hydrolase/transferase [Armatimonadota bacterium]|nr:sulfatase-like hydrolase/transferase [Armatimonadota bacterium]